MEIANASVATMTDLISLPHEILDSICSCANEKTRRNLRLTCRLLADIGRQWVFQKVILRPNPRSYERHRKILAESNVSQAVSKIYLDIRQWHPAYKREIHEEEEEANDADADDGDEDEADQPLPEEFLKIFRRFLESPKLRSVVLRFHPKIIGEDNHWGDDPQDSEFRLNVIKQFMSSFSSAPQLPRELAIQDLHNVNETDPTVIAMITKVLGGLQSLRLNIMNEHSEGNGELDLEYAEPHVFYPEMPSIWLRPAMSNLRHLTIYSSLFFGYYPKFDLTELQFPQLKTLSFGNHCFIHDSQLDWILSHGATLTELYLDDCPILFEVSIKDNQRTYLDANAYEPKPEFAGNFYAFYGRRWCDYFRAFKDGLPHLRHFRYGSSQNWWHDDTTPFECETKMRIGLHSESYMVFCDGFGPSPYMKRSILRNTTPEHPWTDGEPLPASAEDKQALKDLYAKIGQAVDLDADPDDYYDDCSDDDA